MTDFNQTLQDTFREASGVESIALQVEAKIAEIPGAKKLLPARQYGKPVSAEAIRNNMTLRSLIESHSPELAVFFGLNARVAMQRAEEREARELLKTRMALLTEKTAQQNAAAAQRRDAAQRAGLNPWTGTRQGY